MIHRHAGVAHRMADRWTTAAVGTDHQTVGMSMTSSGNSSSSSSSSNIGESVSERLCLLARRPLEVATAAAAFPFVSVAAAGALSFSVPPLTPPFSLHGAVALSSSEGVVDDAVFSPSDDAAWSSQTICESGCVVIAAGACSEQ